MSGVLILGASHSGIAAAAALRGFGYEGVVTVVSNEEAMPYHRPPLSKEALSVAEYSPALLRPENFYKTNRIDLERGTTIARRRYRKPACRLHPMAGDMRMTR